MKSKVHKINVDELMTWWTVPTDFSKLSNVVKNEVFKKTEYAEFVKNVNAIDTSGLVKKTVYNAKIN